MKEEEACDRWRPNEESTSPRSSTLCATPHVGLMAKKEKNVASESEREGESESERESESESESESEDESDDDEFNQHFAHLSKEDKLVMLKFIEKIDEQEETLYKQEELLIKNIKCLEKLTKKHEKLRCSHTSLVDR